MQTRKKHKTKPKVLDLAVFKIQSIKHATKTIAQRNLRTELLNAMIEIAENDLKISI